MRRNSFRQTFQAFSFNSFKVFTYLNNSTLLICSTPIPRKQQQQQKPVRKRNGKMSFQISCNCNCNEIKGSTLRHYSFVITDTHSTRLVADTLITHISLVSPSYFIPPQRERDNRTRILEHTHTHELLIRKR